MNKIFSDLIGISVMLMVMLLIWSSASTDNQAIIMLVITMTLLLAANVYFVVKRETINVIERTVYNCLFFIAASVIFAVLLIDDNGYGVGFIFLLTSSLILGGLGIVTYQELLIKKYSKSIQNSIIFSISVIFTFLSLLTIIGLQ